MTSALFALVLSILALFLIMLVLVQRGRGGGLAGALGGMGGSSAFGAKAGDIFTRITIYAAAVWIIVCVAAVLWANNRGDVLSSGGGAAPISRPESSSPDTSKGYVELDDAAVKQKPAGDAAATESKPAAEAPATPSSDAAPLSTPPSTSPTSGAADTATPPAKSE